MNIAHGAKVQQYEQGNFLIFGANNVVEDYKKELKSSTAMSIWGLTQQGTAIPPFLADKIADLSCPVHTLIEKNGPYFTLRLILLRLSRNIERNLGTSISSD